MAKEIKKVVLAYSGGLDTSIIIPWLKENYDNSKHSCIRIVNNEKFQCGQYIETINESHKDDLIYNISTQKLISQ